MKHKIPKTSFTVTPSGLSITLSNYDSFSTLSVNTITFAGSVCTVSSISLPTIICEIPRNADNSLQLSAGSHAPLVEITNFGRIDERGVSKHEVGLSVNSVGPIQFEFY